MFESLMSEGGRDAFLRRNGEVISSAMVCSMSLCVVRLGSVVEASSSRIRSVYESLYVVEKEQWWLEIVMSSL